MPENYLDFEPDVLANVYIHESCLLEFSIIHRFKYLTHITTTKQSALTYNRFCLYSLLLRRLFTPEDELVDCPDGRH